MEDLVLMEAAEEEPNDGEVGEQGTHEKEVEDNEVAPLLHTYGMGHAYFDNLCTFLQQQDFDTQQLNLDLKKLWKVFEKEHLVSMFQSTPPSF